ncbi:Anti-sigma-V factor RsiV [compost metagenome]
MFTSISKDQSFYINNDSKLVIVFNEYDVAPGAMGSVEFVIPTEVIAGDLVSQMYIQ